MRYLLFIALVLSSLTSPAYAISMEENSDAVTRGMQDYIKDYIDLPAGALDWKILGKTKSVKVDGKTKDGYDFEYFKPVFSDDLKALDGKQVTIKGFMFPLDASDNQKLFLLGPFPISCPFHYHVGPELVVEVHSDKKSVKFSYDPVTLTGVLHLVQKDMENSTFYRLTDVTSVK